MKRLSVLQREYVLAVFKKNIYIIYMHTIKLTSKTSIEQKVPMIVVEPLEVIHPDGDSS